MEMCPSSTEEASPGAPCPPCTWPALLPLELLSESAAFLRPSDVANLLLTVSAPACQGGPSPGSGEPPKPSEIIKRSYLRRNFTYLDSACSSPGNTPSLFRTRLAKVKVWLECNPDWTSWYDNKNNNNGSEEEGAAPLNEKERASFDLNFGNVFVPSSLGCVEVLRHLVEVRGLNPNVPLGGGRRSRGGRDSVTNAPPALYPMHLALVQPNSGVLRYLISRDKKKRRGTRRRRAGSNGDDAAAGSSDEEDADAAASSPLDHAAAEGQLHHAVADDRVSLSNFLLLLSHPGVDVDSRDSRGNTPLHYASQCHVRSSSNDEERLDAMAKARLLIDAGAHPCPRNWEGVSPWDAMAFHLEKRGMTEEEAREGVGAFRRFIGIVNSMEF